MKKNYFASVLLTLIVGLSSSCVGERRLTKSAVQGLDYELIIRAEDSQNRFSLSLVSKSKKDLCASLADWPNILGQIQGGEARAVLKINGEVWPSKDTNFGLCIGEQCGLHISPGKSISGFINFREFGDENIIRAASDKKLDYHMHPSFC